MGFACTVYLDSTQSDVYQGMYDEVSRLNGDFDPIPVSIETFFGQHVDVRNADGYVVDSLRLIHLGKESYNVPFSDQFSTHTYLNYLAIKCCLDTAITCTPSSIYHLSYGMKVLNDIQLSEEALSNEKSFTKELSAYLSAALIENTDNQQVVATIRAFANYGIDNEYWGFNEGILFKLSEVSVQSNNQKTRVSLLDHENGPFTRTEISDISVAIEDCLSIQDRVLVKLAQRFGLRPIQLALLREDDLYFDEKKLGWYLNIPRVKGRQSQLRRNKKNFILRELDGGMAEDIRGLINENLEFRTQNDDLPRPLFKRRQQNQELAVIGKFREFSWHLTSARISKRFLEIADILRIPSRYITDEDGNPQALKMNCYRFRYTLGTRMVMEGKTPEEVAIALDHSTTSSVQHYFRYNRDLIDFIDDTFQSSASLRNAVARWQGFLIDEHDETIQGSIIRVSEIASLGKCLKSTKCELHPTVSCYGCSRFRPFKDADHQKQLEVIQSERDFVISHSSGPVQSQLDEAYEGALHIVEAQKALREGCNV